MDKELLLASLVTLCDVSDDIMFEANAKILTFLQGKARVTIRIAFEDEQSGADLLITNMTTLPDAERNLGNGSLCLNSLIHCAKTHGFKNIQATQVQKQSEKFWKDNGFVAMNNPTNDYAYART